MSKHIHILNASPNLAGISLVIIAGLNVSDRAKSTSADEIAWVAALAFVASCFFSYIALRSEPYGERYETVADRAFLLGLGVLFVSVLALALHY